jgi:hypothetical protein
MITLSLAAALTGTMAIINTTSKVSMPTTAKIENVRFIRMPSLGRARLGDLSRGVAKPHGSIIEAQAGSVNRKLVPDRSIALGCAIRAQRHRPSTLLPFKQSKGYGSVSIKACKPAPPMLAVTYQRLKEVDIPAKLKYN